MHALFDEAGKFLAGRILSEAEASFQIELETGKRVKVKAAHVLLKFEKPAPAQLLGEAQQLASSIDLDLAWEFAPENEFGFAELAALYFSDPPTLVQQAAALLRLHEAPHYFRRAGKGKYKKAPAEIVQQALAAIEKKRLQQIQIAEWAQQLAQGECPAPIREQLYKILFKPDKNAPEYKAVVEAARATQKAPLTLLQAAGAIDSPYQFHWKRFLFENFPKGYGFPSGITAPEIKDELPVAPVQAYSIDDSLTTEIDDALSVQGLGSGTVTVGVHIAAPGLAVQPGDAIDKLGRERLSTVYMPGWKITMLPDDVVQRYTLEAGRDCPAVSLYVKFKEDSLEVIDSVTRLERVPIAHNLRHDRIDGVVTEEWLANPAYTHAEPDPEPLTPALRAELSFLHRLAKHLKAQREIARGKPENFSRPDYNFRLSAARPPEGAKAPSGGSAAHEVASVKAHTFGNGEHEPRGDEQVQISVRPRGAALDLIVSEAMILANSTWGQWLSELGVPAIYRSQASLAPGVKVRMGVKALPHAGLGVKSYAWSTSPLRRYTDLVNQWQIIAGARHGKTAALAAPFKPKDAELFAIISGFDAAYATYNSYQASIERYWTLKYLQQNGISELEATVFKDNLARADTLPLVLPVLGAQDLPRGTRVRVKLGEVDEVALDVSATLLARLDSAADAADDEGGDEEEALAAGPIAIAVDVNEALQEAPGDNPAP